MTRTFHVSRDPESLVERARWARNQAAAFVAEFDAAMAPVAAAEPAVKP